MATPEDEIEVLIDDAPKTKDELLAGEDEGSVKVETSTADDKVAKDPKTVVAPEEGIEQLKANLAKAEEVAASERQAREEAERREAAARNRAAQSDKAAQDTELALVSGAIESLKQSQDVLKTNYAAAMQAGDYGEAADINLKMSDTSAKLLQLETGKANLEADAKAPRREERPADPVEFIATQLTPQSAAWIRSHPEYARDQQLWARVVSADGLAKSYGIKADTPEYFEHVEKTLGLKQEGGSPTATPTPRREAAPAAAPASRHVEGNGVRPNTVRLTAQEVEMAEMMGMSPKEYAVHKRALQSEGKLH